MIFFITYCCYKLYWQRKPRTSLTLQIIRVYSFAIIVKLFALIILSQAKVIIHLIKAEI